MTRKVRKLAKLKRYWSDAGHDTPVAIADGPSGAVKTVGDEYLVTLVATTEDIDSDDEVVVSSGVAPDSYMFDNRSVFLDHDYSIGSFIGKVRRFIPDPADTPKRWLIQVRLLRDHQYTPMILELAREGAIGASIGFSREDWGEPTKDEIERYSQGNRVPRYITRRWHWIETSITAIPANVHAQAVGVDVATDQILAAMVESSKISKDFAQKLGYCDEHKPDSLVDKAKNRVVYVVDSHA